MGHIVLCWSILWAKYRWFHLLALFCTIANVFPNWHR